MNKLRDKIRQATEVRSAGLGFASAGRKKSPSLLLLVRGARNAVAQVSSQVDGYLLSSPGDQPPDAGAAARGLIAEDGNVPSSAEFDFLLLDEQTPASALLSDELSYLMRADANMPDSQLRALHALPLDGLVTAADGPLTVGAQLSLLRLSGFAGKPLFVEVSKPPSSSDLEVLREAGAVGIVVNADLGAASITELRQSIDNLPPRRRTRRDERETVALVGQVTPAGGEQDEFDEE